MEEIAFYFWNFDRELSHTLLDADRVVQSYLSGDNVFVYHDEQIDGLWKYMKDHRHYLANLGFANYDGIMDFLA